MSWDPQPGTKGPAGGDLGGTYPDPSVAKVPAAALTAGSGTTVTTVTGKAEVAVPTAPIVAETSSTGVALINGTQTILSATVPNDGKVHVLLVGAFIKTVSAALTGGAVRMKWTDANDGGVTVLTTSTAVAGYTKSSQSSSAPTLKSGSQVIIEQTTAATAGAAKVYAKIVVI